MFSLQALDLLRVNILAVSTYVLALMCFFFLFSDKIAVTYETRHEIIPL